MQKAGVGIPTWIIGVLLMVPLVGGLDIALFSQPLFPEDIDDQEERFHRSEETAGTEVVGSPQYRQYHANDSLIGQPVPCSHEEKVCFGYNMLYDKKKQWCVDLKKYHGKFSSGHLVAAERVQLKCDGYVMAYDDQCYRKDVVEGEICGCNIKPSPHLIHGVECRCTPPTPIHVEQPKEEGRCHIPDLRFPDKDLSRFSINPHQDIQGFTSDQEYLNMTTPVQFDCSRKQLNCFARNKVWAARPTARARKTAEAGPGDCRSLLERGHCDEEHVVALDVQAAREGRVETTCVHVRGGCEGEEQVRLSFDDKCHREKDVKLVTNGKVFRNQFGFFVIAPDNIMSLTFVPYKEESTGRCAVKVHRFFVSDPFNVSNKRYFSKLYETKEAAPSRPEV